MKRRIAELRGELGPLALAAAVLIAGALAFLVLVVQPLEARGRSVAERLARLPSGAPAADPSRQLDAIYGHLAQPGETTDCLARLYAIGKATGVELQSATYASESAGRIERYRIVLPLNGSYAQMRAFLNRALAEIPALSLDQLKLRRETARDDGVQAELKMTLHIVEKS